MGCGFYTNQKFSTICNGNQVLNALANNRVLSEFMKLFKQCGAIS